MSAPTQKIQLSPDVIVQMLDNEAVLLHLKTEEYFTLDTTGARIWQLLSEYGEQEPVLRQIQEEFEVDETIAKHDLTHLICELREKGLLDVYK